MECKKWGKVLSFQDNRIFTGVNYVSYSRTGYLSLTVNMLRSNAKT